MTVNLTDPIFSDENKARAYFEAIRWPDGVVCCHCGNTNSTRIYPIAENTAKKVRAGLYECQDCHGQFTVRTGSIMESSHLPLTKWALAYRLMASSKKGMSAHQLMRTIGVTYKTAWFVAHRIREAMRETAPEPLGGNGSPVEADETYVGGKPRKNAGPRPTGVRPHERRNQAKMGGGTDKAPVVALIERNGRSVVRPVADVTAATLGPILRLHIAPNATLMTDEHRSYITVGREFAAHERVSHGEGEYARGSAHINTAEAFFALLKRGITGSFHHVSREHLARYCDEFSFRWDRRSMDDTDRAIAAIKGGEGKRLTYRPAR